MTREVFQNFTLLMKVGFYVLATAALALFARGIYLKVAKYRRGRAAGPFPGLGRRLWSALWAAGGLGSRLVRGDRRAGIAHLLIFWGFVCEWLGTVILTIDHDLARPLGMSFFHGAFYAGYSLVLDVMGVALLAGLVFMMARRAFARPARLDYRRADGAALGERGRWPAEDWALLAVLFLLTVGGFVVEGMRILADRPAFEMHWSPVGWQVANLLAGAGLSPEAAAFLHTRSWWFHATLALIFVALFPYTKAQHMLAALASLAFRDEMAAKRLPGLHDPEGAPGYGSLSDMTWRELLMLDACTRCGRCHESCPARASGAPLSPRDVVLDLRAHADRVARARAATAGTAAAMTAPALAGGVVSADALWSCTTCRACVERCPVGVEHVPLIVQMRRRLVDQGELDENLQDTLVRLSRQGNSFGQSERMRGRWAKELDVPVKDIRKEPAHYLWFVGDYASFDPRVQEVTRAAARVFRRAGMDFGIMYEGERNAGNDVRRAGEEGLFEMLAEHNIKAMSRCRFEEIVTTDPHSYNTLKNEYPDYGGEYRVYHYTEVLDRLVQEGKLSFPRRLGVRATYHDPCYLGRYNGVFDPPRRLLRALGVDLVEMPRHRENSFCCGAGGGRIWMGDSLYKEKPGESRVREAAALGVGLFVVACPKDLAMYQDAVKTAGLEGKLVVKDILQLMDEALAGEEA